MYEHHFMNAVHLPFQVLFLSRFQAAGRQPYSVFVPPSTSCFRNTSNVVRFSAHQVPSHGDSTYRFRAQHKPRTYVFSQRLCWREERRLCHRSAGIALVYKFFSCAVAKHHGLRIVCFVFSCAWTTFPQLKILCVASTSNLKLFHALQSYRRTNRAF